MFIAILDYTTGEVIIKDVPKEFEELDGDDILVNMGYSQSNSNYMIVNDDLHLSISAGGSEISTTLMK